MRRRLSKPKDDEFQFLQRTLKTEKGVFFSSDKHFHVTQCHAMGDQHVRSIENTFWIWPISITDLFTRRVEKLVVTQLVKKFRFHEHGSFATIFTKAYHRTLFSANWTTSISEIHFNIILPSRIALPRCIFPWRFPAKILFAFLICVTYPFVQGHGKICHTTKCGLAIFEYANKVGE